MLWGRGGVVVSALDFRSEGRWFDGRLEGGVVSLDNILRPSLSLSTQVYGYRRHTAVGKPCNGLASRPGGSSNTLSCFKLRKPG